MLHDTSKQIVLEFVDHEEMLRQSRLKPIFINDIDLRETEGQETFRNLLYTTYSSEALSPIASCLMGCTTGQSHMGHICEECGTMVQVPVDREPEPIAWMRTPDGVDTFINPLLFAILEQALMIGARPAFSMLMHLLDPFYTMTKAPRRETGIFLFSGGSKSQFNEFIKRLGGDWKVITPEDMADDLEDEAESEDVEDDDNVNVVETLTERIVELKARKSVAIHATDPDVAGAIAKWTGSKRPIQIWEFENGEYQCRKNNAGRLTRFLDLKIPRGINHFHAHYKEIIDTLFQEDILSEQDEKHRDTRALLYSLTPHQIFSQHIPIPNRLCLVVEAGSRGPRSDSSTVDLVNACGAIAEIDSYTIPLSPNRRASRVAKVNKQLADYHYKFIQEQLRPDSGWYRGNVYGTSLGYSARTVITSIIEPHHWEELHYPWAASVRMLSEHIANRLRKRNYPPEDIHNIIADAQNAISKDDKTDAYRIVGEAIDELFELARFIPGTTIKGIPVIDVRYPSLYRGSIQLLWITKVLRDPQVNAARMPMPVLAAYNADFENIRHIPSKRWEETLSGKPIELLGNAQYCLPWYQVAKAGNNKTVDLRRSKA